eukprot:14384775-Alexandrium_andersonii.AAC.1
MGPAGSHLRRSGRHYAAWRASAPAGGGGFSALPSGLPGTGRRVGSGSDGSLPRGAGGPPTATSGFS